MSEEKGLNPAILDIARAVATESWERASGMIDAVLAGEPLESCLSRASADPGSCCNTADESCCGNIENKTSYC